MKSFVMLRLPMLLCGLGAALILSPACKAQSEVAPDHFDGTDSWEVAYQAAPPKSHQQKPAVEQARTQKPSSAATLQLTAVRDVTSPTPQDAVAIQGKHKPARKPKNQ
jgi:hypothetical protein